jgi:3-oxoacyl-[acyl-carrier-protein] synthase-3
MNDNIAIVGIGTWLPTKTKANSDWPESFSKRDHIKGDRTFNDIPASDDQRAAEITFRDLSKEMTDPFLGAKIRHIADDTTSSAQAEVFAAEQALLDAGISGSEVDVVLSNALVPERVCPYNAPYVIHAIGAKNGWAASIDQACASIITQLEFAWLLIQSGRAKVVLITQSHLILRTTPPLHPAAPGLGDGASAIVVKKGNGLAIRATHTVTHGEFSLAVTYIRGVDDNTDTPWWKAGGDFCAGSRDPSLAKFLMRETVAFGSKTVREAAEKANIDVQHINVLASVMPRGFIPGAIAEHLGLPRDRAPTTYEETAHLGGSGILFNLARARTLNMFTPNGYIALYGQGSGFTRAAAILQYVPA